MITNQDILRQLWMGKEEELLKIRSTCASGHGRYPHIVHSMLVFNIDKPDPSINKIGYHIKLLFCNKGCIGGGELLNTGLSLMKQLDSVIELSLKGLMNSERQDEYEYTYGFASLTSTNNAKDFYKKKFLAEEVEGKPNELVINYRTQDREYDLMHDRSKAILTEHDKSQCIREIHTIDEIVAKELAKSLGGKNTQRKNKRKHSTRKKRRST